MAGALHEGGSMSDEREPTILTEAAVDQLFRDRVKEEGGVWRMGYRLDCPASEVAEMISKERPICLDALVMLGIARRAIITYEFTLMREPK